MTSSCDFYQCHIREGAKIILLSLSLDATSQPYLLHPYFHGKISDEIHSLVPPPQTFTARPAISY